MARAYSLDLREKAIRLIKEKKWRVEAVSDVLHVSRASVFRWFRRQKEEGSAAKRENSWKGYGPAVEDVRVFKTFVDQHQGRTARHMAQLWGVSGKTMGKWLRRIGYTRKKRLMPTGNGTKKSAAFIWTR